MNQELYDQLLNAASVMVGISKFDEALKEQRQIQDGCGIILYDIEKKIKDTRKTFNVLTAIVGVFSAPYFLGFLIMLLFPLSVLIAIPFILPLLLLALLAIAIIIVVRIFVMKSLKKKYAEKKEEYDSVYNEAEETIAELLKKLDEYGEETEPYVAFLPKVYRNPDAIGFMMEAVKNLRADNLKEAINLYEHEMHMREQERILNNIAEIQEEQNRNMMYAMNEITQNQTRISSTLRNIKDIQIIDFLSRY